MNKTPSVLFLWIGFLFCSHGYASDCPSRDFFSFLSIFSERIDIQKNFIEFPLQKSYVVDALPEPKKMHSLLNKEQVKYPVMPNANQRRKDSLVIHVSQDKNDEAKVDLLMEDTGFLVTYFFTRNSCWKLIRIDDQSL